MCGSEAGHGDIAVLPADALSSVHAGTVAKQKSKPSERDQPVMDRAREASEDLGPGAPVTTRLADDEEAETAYAAGVTAAGESDRPAGTHVPPEYPVAEVPAEIDVDAVHTLDGDEEEAGPDERLEGREEPPDAPASLGRSVRGQREPSPTVKPRGSA
jgi:hypothetical protein